MRSILRTVPANWTCPLFQPPEPPENLPKTRSAGADEVRDHQGFAAADRIVPHKPGQGRRLARAGWTRNKAWDRGLAVGELDQMMLHFLPAHVDPQARLHERLVKGRLLGQRVAFGQRLDRRHLGQIVFGLDRLPELILNSAPKLLQANESSVGPRRPVEGLRVPLGRIAVHHRASALPGSLFQIRKFLAAISGPRFRFFGRERFQFLLSRAFAEDLPVLGVQLLDERRGAEIEERPPSHLRVVEHAIEDLQLRDAPARVVLHPTVLAGRLLAERTGHPAVALAQDAHEIRPALVDLLKAEVQDPIVLGLFFGDPPAEVDVDQMNSVLLQSLA